MTTFPSTRCVSIIALTALITTLALAAPARHGHAQPPATATPTPLPDLIMDGGRMQLSGTHAYRRVVLQRGAQIELKPFSGADNTGRLDITAEWIEIDKRSSIVGDFAGYRGRLRLNGEGPGGGEGGARSFDGGGGGGYGGRGGDGVLDDSPTHAAKGGRTYGDNCSKQIDMGSGGGAPGTADNVSDPGAGGDGGGAVSLVARTVLMSGTIQMDGADGIVAANDASGGGSGGGVLIQADTLALSGDIQANGGKGGETDDGGGGGGGGRIKVFYRTGSFTRNMHVDGGKGDGNGSNNNGQPGTICIETLPTPTPTSVDMPVATPVASSTATLVASPTATIVASPTATIVASPTATPTLVPTRTPTVRPTATSTSTPTATPVPGPIFLPILLNDKCLPADIPPVAVALVVDASTSMKGATRGGRTKLAAALEAARVPIGLMTRPDDQLTVIVFNDAARVLVPLTHDRSALLAALARVTMAPGSRMDAGVRLAMAELDRAPAGAERRMAVLTDGRPNPTTPADAIAAADDARGHGIVVDTIGLGADVDPQLLARMALPPGSYHFTPDAEDLTLLFGQLAFVPPPCGGAIIWPGH